jgi:hypothetical protein
VPALPGVRDARARAPGRLAGRAETSAAAGAGPPGLPGCGALWDDQDRREANADAILVHRGQEVGPDRRDHRRPAGDRDARLPLDGGNNLLVGSATSPKEWKASPGPRRGERRQGRAAVRVGPAQRGRQGRPERSSTRS